MASELANGALLHCEERGSGPELVCRGQAVGIVEA